MSSAGAGAGASDVVMGDENHHAITLYQYAICPFCNKAKALLSYASQPYDSVEVNPLTKAEIKALGDGKYKKVPVATIGDGTSPIMGSHDILMALLEQPHIQSNLQEKWKGTDMTLEKFNNTQNHTSKWLAYADDELASLLYPNICQTLGDSYTAFGYVHNTPTFSTMQRYAIQGVGSFAMYMAASQIKKKRGIVDEREALQKALTKFDHEALLPSSGNKFASQADAPDLGDIVVYGVLRSVEGLPAHDEMVMNHSTSLKDWYLRMQEHVNY
jgi:microsomal prostaglandin-E synthase 2